MVKETHLLSMSAGNLLAEYSVARPEPNPNTKWTVTDQLGSPRILVNSLGEVVSRRDFLPFGEEITPDGTHRNADLKYNFGDNIRQKFTGYQKDEETQLDFAEARMYQNLHGRFTAVDPLLASGKSANPQTFNRYVYVMNNPLIYTDPTGLQAASTPDDITPCRRNSNCNISLNRETNTASGSGFALIDLVVDVVADIGEVIQDTAALFTLNGDPLANASAARIQARLDAASGDPESAEMLNQRILPNQGPTVDSVLDETTRAVQRAKWVGEIGLSVQLLFLAPAAAGSRNVTMASNSGLSFGSNPFSTLTTSSQSAASTRLIGVPEAALNRMIARVEGINVGGNKVFSNIEAFGSRAGSTFRGRGPLPTSDLDIMLTPNRPLASFNTRSENHIYFRLGQIRTDFEATTGFPVNFTLNSARRSIQQTPFIPLVIP